MSTSQPVPVTVVIPARNAAGTIARQLSALRAQVGAPSFRVIVVDNGSQDRTAHVARAFADGTFHLDVVIERRRGINFARNAGVRAASDGVIALCDADDQVSTSWLATLLATRGDREWCGGGLDYVTLNSPRTRQIWTAPDSSRPAERSDPYLDRTYGCNCAFPRSLWEEVGGFDVTLSGSGGDENEFFMRAHAAGFTYRDVPDAIVAYRLRPGIGAMVRQRFKQGRNQAKMESRPGGLLLESRPALGPSAMALGRTVLALPKHVWSKRSFFLWLGAVARRSGRVAELVGADRGRRTA